MSSVNLNFQTVSEHDELIVCDVLSTDFLVAPPFDAERIAVMYVAPGRGFFKVEFEAHLRDEFTPPEVFLLGLPDAEIRSYCRRHGYGNLPWSRRIFKQASQMATCPRTEQQQ